jgi:hypothetical protein
MIKLEVFQASEGAELNIIERINDLKFIGRILERLTERDTY